MAPFTLTAAPVARLPIPGWEAFFGENDTTFHDLWFYVWLVTDGTRTGLIDVGLPLDADDRSALDRANQGVDPRCQFHDVRLLPEVLAEFGVRGEDIDFVLVTQTITYHTGGLLAELLPRATVYASYAGVREMLCAPPGHPPTEFYFTSDSWSYLRTLAIEGRLVLTDEPVTVAPGLVFETTGGHHPGSAGVRVDCAHGVVGLLETAFFDRNIAETLPIGIAEDAAACRRAIKDYRRLCDEVVALHDPGNAARFPHGPGPVTRSSLGT
ncbi:MBL fold metallo-hydrolase [Micromonospora sonchi]|uniref:MBL fold metallo-hydrolase n=1 Tax=Micromonospora sonchi TaxID=1763543 RepID=A0A917U2F2_9ACTN|nr:hypothetical protein [Micromonospora sonchi]GGM53419.1 MBL fold metallo-hydrolase [Micromonospora sonchi]